MMTLLFACAASREPEVEPTTDETPVEVVVATRDLPAGERIQPDAVGLRLLPADVAPDAALFEMYIDVLGQFPRERILEGEPIRRERLLAPDPGLGVATIIVPGKRALTLPGVSPSGLAPGDWVDIAWAPDRARTRNAALDGGRTIVQSSRVLAVGTCVVGAEIPCEPADETVTLELSAQDAVSVLAARASGQLVVALRSGVDYRAFQGSTVYVQDLLGDSAPSTVPEAGAPQRPPPLIAPRPHPAPG